MTPIHPVPFNAKCVAIRAFEYTRYPRRPRLSSLDRVNYLLSIFNYDEAIAGATEVFQSARNGSATRCLDLRLRAYMGKQDYIKALEDAILMQQHSPWTHYGYIREVQLQLILDNCTGALSALQRGFMSATTEKDIKALMRSAKLLDQVAADFAMMKNFGDAHQVADMLIISVPSFPVGYLRAGTLFLLQGKVDDALNVYDRGIAAAAISDRHLLVDRKKLVLRQLNGNDYLTRASYDIVENILRYLNTHDLFTCLDVCYDWRTLIQDHPEAWRSVVICNHSNMSFIQQARSHIRTIQIPAVESCQVKLCLELIAEGEFPNLVALEVDNDSPPFTPECFNESGVIQRYGFASKIVGHFKYQNKKRPNRPSLPTCKHAYNLLICKPEEVQSIVRFCPNLPNFVFDLSNLKVHGLETNKPTENDGYEKYTKAPWGGWVHDTQNWADLPTIASPVIRKIVLSFETNFRSKEWIGNCPALEDITLKNLKKMDGTIFYAIKRLPKLCCLKLQSCKCSPSSPRFRTFFQMLDFKGDKVELHTLILNNFDMGWADDYLLSVAAFKRLRRLHIINCKTLTGFSLVSFSEMLMVVGGLLEELVIAEIKEVTDQTLLSIVNNIPKLQRLTLEQLDKITDHGIYEIMSRSKLSVLNIRNCPEITERGMDYTQSLRLRCD